jgi:hypothetical protein
MKWSGKAPCSDPRSVSFASPTFWPAESGAIASTLIRRMRASHARLMLGTVVSPLAGGVALAKATTADDDTSVDWGFDDDTFTRLKLRRNRRPQRAASWLWPGTTRMAPCPEA